MFLILISINYSLYVHICIALRDWIVYLYVSWRIMRLSNLNNWTDQVLKAIDRLSLNCIIKVFFSPLRALWAKILRFILKKRHRQYYYYDKLDPLNLFFRYEQEMNNLSTYKIWQLLGQYFSASIKRDAFDFLLLFVQNIIM